MRNDNFYHALKVDNELCYGCTHCMMACPTNAIRIDSGKAVIIDERCIDCGECVKACPVDAIYVEQDDFSKIFEYDYRVAIVPAVFLGQFSKKISIAKIISAIKETGFTHVFLAEESADVINEAMLEEYDSEREKPLISPFCPAVVRLIQVKFPGMVENIIPVKTPVDSTALYCRQLLEDKGLNRSSTGVFYVTPCAAKIAALKSTCDENDKIFNGVINMDILYNKVFHIFKTHTDYEMPGSEELFSTSAKVLEWSLTEGETANMQGRCLAIDEVQNVMKFLERVEDGDIINVDFLELRACDRSCAGGVLMSENRFLTVERIRKKAANIKDNPTGNLTVSGYLQYLKENVAVNEFEPRSMLKLDENMEVAYRKVQRIRHLMCFLPGIDCGACGAPNCQSLAEDIVQNRAHLSNCIFIQRSMEKNRKLSNDHAIRIIEKVWGEERLNKNCNKKGAENETD
jgi:Na+-translocating ferredoxin:NAD+ oxidoreductase RNF subunit RnfB